MKLIRLVTEDQNSIFDNTFNDSLTLKPNSKIALQSLSIETENNVIEIDGTNDSITFRVTAGIYTSTISLSRSTYNKNNYLDLLKDIQERMNNATGFELATAPNPFPIRRNFGLEWKVETNTKNKVSIAYRIGTWGEYLENWDFNPNNVIRLQVSNKFIWRIALAQPDYNAGNQNSLLLPYYISTGCSLIRCRTNKFETTLNVGRNRNGYIIALSRTDLSTKKPSEILDSDISYGIQVASTTGGIRRYWTIVDGVFAQDAIFPEYQGNGDTNNDYQEVSINFDRVELNVYQNTTGDQKIRLADFNYIAGEKLYPLLILRGKNADINGVRTLVSPYSLDPEVSTQEVQLVGAPPIPIRFPSDNQLEMSVSLSNFLGYDNPIIPRGQPLKAVEVDYIADKVFEPSEIADAFLIELLNLKCESYDGFLNQRKNILAVVPKSNAGGEVIYETNTPFFIDLNNKNEILLRNIRCRVVRPDYSVLPMRGLASMVLLIDSS